MRLFVSLAVLGLACAAMPAMAQQTTTTSPQVVYAVPMYNASPNSYYQPGVGGSPVYNNGSAQPYAMNQMIAGKNAPSYNFNRNNACCSC